MANEIQELVKELGKVPPELKKQLRPGLRRAGNIVANEARRRASWSTRIPRATRVSITFGQRTSGVAIVVNRKKAPHARPYENGGRAGTFRHPRWGDREHWYSQKARPFLAPALIAKGDKAAGEIADVVDRVTRDAGFR